eukprot:403373121
MNLQKLSYLRSALQQKHHFSAQSLQFKQFYIGQNIESSFKFLNISQNKRNFSANSNNPSNPISADKLKEIIMKHKKEMNLAKQLGEMNKSIAESETSKNAQKLPQKPQTQYNTQKPQIQIPKSIAKTKVKEQQKNTRVISDIELEQEILGQFNIDINNPHDDDVVSNLDIDQFLVEAGSKGKNTKKQNEQAPPQKGVQLKAQMNELGEIEYNNYQKQQERDKEHIKRKKDAKRVSDSFDINVVSNAMDQMQSRLDKKDTNVKGLQNRKSEGVQIQTSKKMGRPKKVKAEEVVEQQEYKQNKKDDQPQIVHEVPDILGSQTLKKTKGRPKKQVESPVQQQQIQKEIEQQASSIPLKDEYKSKPSKADIKEIQEPLNQSQKATTKSKDAPINSIPKKETKKSTTETPKPTKSQIKPTSSGMQNTSSFFELKDDEDILKVKYSEELRKISKSQLNEQDLADLEELRELEKLAGVRQDSGYKHQDRNAEMQALMKDKQFLLDEEIKELDLKREENRGKAKSWAYERIRLRQDSMELNHELDQQEEESSSVLADSEFLSIYEIPSINSLKVDLKLPRFKLNEDNVSGVFTISFQFDYDTLKRMKDNFDLYENIVAFTDGSSIRNPGNAGSSCVFMGKRKQQSYDNMQLIRNMNGINDSIMNTNINKKPDREFLFGLTVALGQASNNYAEYTGVIMAQLIFSMFKQKEIHILTDSMLVVNQIKGVARTQNFRLIELIKIVHSLAFKFETMNLDYIEREQNKLADALARESSKNAITSTGPQFRVVFNMESLIQNVNFK